MWTYLNASSKFTQIIWLILLLSFLIEILIYMQTLKQIRRGPKIWWSTYYYHHFIVPYLDLREKWAEGNLLDVRWRTIRILHSKFVGVEQPKATPSMRSWNLPESFQRWPKGSNDLTNHTIHLAFPLVFFPFKIRST
jgi:hypothetical protein